MGNIKQSTTIERQGQSFASIRLSTKYYAMLPIDYYLSSYFFEGFRHTK